MTHHRCKKKYQILVGKEIAHEIPYKNLADRTLKDLRKQYKGTITKVQMKKVKC